MYPYPNPSLLGKSIEIIKNVKWGSLLDGTQKTLGLINQAIPVFYQVKPIVSNAKTFFKIASSINSSDSNSNVESSQKKEDISSTNSSVNKPIFYL